MQILYNNKTIFSLLFAFIIAAIYYKYISYNISEDDIAKYKGRSVYVGIGCAALVYGILYMTDTGTSSISAPILSPPSSRIKLDDDTGCGIEDISVSASASVSASEMSEVSAISDIYEDINIGEPDF